MKSFLILMLILFFSCTSNKLSTPDGEVERPILIYKAPPTYPDAARVNNLEGQVFVVVTIELDGTVSDAQIYSSAHPEFIEPALEAARKCKFTPMKKNGKLMRAKLTFPFTFSPDNTR